MMTMHRIATNLLIAVLLTAPAVAEPRKKRQKTAPTPDKFSEAIRDLEAKSGLLNFYLDSDAGKVLLELPASAAEEPIEVLYVEGLATGLGSNPVGLDRAQLGRQQYRYQQVGCYSMHRHHEVPFRGLGSRKDSRTSSLRCNSSRTRV